jgi:hypothetical protein
LYYVPLKKFSLIQNSKIGIVLNVIIIKEANTKSSVGQNRSPINAKEGAGAAEE